LHGLELSASVAMSTTNKENNNMSKFEVVVSNVGTVWVGNNPIDADREYGECKRLSESRYGRFAGESVTIYKDGEVIQEYIGTNDNE
jgi:hypothetical protein